MEARIFANGRGEWLPYRLHIPERTVPGQRYPLLVFLHGAGERGLDNQSQLKHAQILRLVREGEPCFFVAPQCPTPLGRFLLAGSAPLPAVELFKVRLEHAARWQSVTIDLGRYANAGTVGQWHLQWGRAEGQPRTVQEFRNVRLYDRDHTEFTRVVDFRELDFALTGEGATDYEIGPHGRAISMTTTRHASMTLRFPFVVEPATILQFDFRTPALGRYHALALDNAIDHRWVQADWSDPLPWPSAREPSRPMRSLVGLLDALGETWPIDPDRRYLAGHSMGGFGVFDLLMRRPRDFAAAVVLCGGGDDARAGEIAHIPLWLFHAADDGEVPVERSRSMCDALCRAGGAPRYSEYPSGGHAVWEHAYAEPGLSQWLFAQRR